MNTPRKTHDLDLNAILEQVRNESLSGWLQCSAARGWAYYKRQTGEFIGPNSHASATHCETRAFVAGSFTALVLNKVAAHPDGIFAMEIKDWLRSGDSAHAAHPEADKRVDTALTRLKSHYGVIVKKIDGKWYPVTENVSSQEQAA
jgi:hypothetical protein